MAQATYTLAQGEDNAPLTGTYVVGSGDDRVSDPSTSIATGRDAVQPAAHLLAVDRHRAGVAADAGFAARWPTTTSSG